jgi:3-deoxy-D-manno-octulosonic-acid transferase
MISDSNAMIYFLYNIIVTCILLISSPYSLAKSLFRKRFRRALAQRMGFFQTPSFKRSIWVHAASVGEVFCSAPLIKKIKKEFPNFKIILTTMTSMGNETAKVCLPETDLVLFLPIDHPLFIRRAIGKIQPSLLLIAETELWPNLLRSCGKKGIPIVLFNGRISQKSFRGYLLLRFLFRRCLRYISLFIMQTEEDRMRIIEIGGESQKTRAVGNLKFEQALTPSSSEAVDPIAKALGMEAKRNILIAGSTHPGEEDILLAIFKKLKKKDPDLLLILAPRHLERLEEVESILKKESLSWLRKTSLSLDEHRSDQGQLEVILLDTMGELMGIYSLGTLIFVGGSLVPIGGHNPLEPLFFRKCVLFGPYMFNFSEISSRLIEIGGAIQVEGKEDLYSQLKRLLSDEGARKEVGKKGYQFLLRHQGAIERTMEEIRPFLTRIKNSEL